MTPVTTIEGRACPFERKNVDTDVVIRGIDLRAFST